VNAGIPPKRLEHAGPWEIASAVPYQPDFLVLHTAPRHDVNHIVLSCDERAKATVVLGRDQRGPLPAAM